MDIRSYAIDYIRNLTTSEKDRLRTMLSHGIVCGVGYAKKNNVDAILFNNELKSILEEKE